MQRFVLPALVAAALACASIPAAAGDRLSPGGAAALGALGGFALGAAVGASAQPLPPPPPPVVVERAPRRVYVERPVRHVIVERPVEECFVQRERVWVPGWGWEVRRRTVCE